MKIDPYNHERRYKQWMEKSQIEGVSELREYNSNLIIKYLLEREN